MIAPVRRTGAGMHDSAQEREGRIKDAQEGSVPKERYDAPVHVDEARRRRRRDLLHQRTEDQHASLDLVRRALPAPRPPPGPAAAVCEAMLADLPWQGARARARYLEKPEGARGGGWDRVVFGPRQLGDAAQQPRERRRHERGSVAPLLQKRKQERVCVFSVGVRGEHVAAQARVSAP